MISYETISVKPVTPYIGAEISNVDLSQPLSNQTVEEMHKALAEHLVLFFRDQDISHEDHKRFGRLFGDLHIHSGVGGIDGHKEIVKIHADETSKFVAGENWHSDLSCDEVPPMGSALWVHTTPEAGGDTGFASMYAAYDALSPAMKTYIDGMTATHDGARVFAKIYNEPTKVFPRHSHPIVRTHPVTGRKALYVNREFTEKIDGVSREESEAVLKYLVAHAERTEFQCRFHWKPKSLALWDNRCAQHKAHWDYFPHTRSGFRVTIAGDAPY